MKNLFKFRACQVFSPGTLIKKKYEAFKLLLAKDFCAHETMAELESIFYNRTRTDLQAVLKRYNRLDACVSSMVEALLEMNPSQNATLGTYYKKFNSYVRFMLEPEKVDTAPPFTMGIDEIPMDGLTLAGTKAFNLAGIRRDAGLPVPRGFVITTRAFHLFMKKNRLIPVINDILGDLDINCPKLLEKSAKKIQSMIMEASLPREIISAINRQVEILGACQNLPLNLAVRSSALGEDTSASFAGQYLTILNVKKEKIVHACKQVMASKYSAQALFYRISKGFFDHETPMAVLVLEMVNARASGIIYTRRIENPRNSEDLVIHLVKGLGDCLVGGEASSCTKVIADRGSPPVIACSHGEQTEDLPDPMELATLAQWGAALEDFFKSPQDIEWSMDQSRNLFILQSRPLNLYQRAEKISRTSRPRTISNPVLIRGGETAAPGAASGNVFLVKQLADLMDMPKGAIVVSRNACPGLVMILDRARAVITDLGSCSGHLATVAREFNTPTLVNTRNATTSLIHGTRVTVDADRKVVYSGKVPELLESSKNQDESNGDKGFQKSPFMNVMGFIMEFISPLGLLDPASPAFTPEGCRSIHDIIRFAHETAVQEMFSLGKRRGGRKKGAKRLVSDLPMLFYLLDVGDGLAKRLEHQKEVKIEEITSIPLTALLHGLNHPDICWSNLTHFDWESHDRIILSGGIISTQAPQFGSYAIFSSDYLNVNLRFGYHFVVVDTLCTEKETDNYILFRFSGGGADPRARMLRAGFTKGVLKNLGFEVAVCEDLVDGRFSMGTASELIKILDMLGRLLGATRLMDMYLAGSIGVDGRVNGFIDDGFDNSANGMVGACGLTDGFIENLVNDFMNGRYDFSSTRGC